MVNPKENDGAMAGSARVTGGPGAVASGLQELADIATASNVRYTTSSLSPSVTTTIGPSSSKEVSRDDRPAGAVTGVASCTPRAQNVRSSSKKAIMASTSSYADATGGKEDNAAMRLRETLKQQDSTWQPDGVPEGDKDDEGSSEEEEDSYGTEPHLVSTASVGNSSGTHRHGAGVKTNLGKPTVKINLKHEGKTNDNSAKVVHLPVANTKKEPQDNKRIKGTQQDMKESQENQDCKVVTAEWIKSYIELQKYYQLNGDCKVPTKGPFKNKELSKWLGKQKKEYKLWRMLQSQSQQGQLPEGTPPCEMTEERIHLLENIGIKWDEEERDVRRNNGGGGRARSGKAGGNVHHSHHGDNHNHGNRNWAKNPVQNKDGGQAIPNEQNGKGHIPNKSTCGDHLSGAGDLSFMADGEWKERYVELRQFHDTHKHTRVPQTYPPNPALVAWITEQRKQHKLLQRKKPSRITNQQIQLLEQLGFEWKADEMQEWRKRYKELQLFKSKYVHVDVAIAGDEFNELKSWCSKQREEKKLLLAGESCNITWERVQMLDGIGFRWNDHEDAVATGVTSRAADVPDEDEVDVSQATDVAESTAKEVAVPLKKIYRKRKFISSRKRSSKSESSSSANSDQPSMSSTHLPKKIKFHTHNSPDMMPQESENGSDDSDEKIPGEREAVANNNENVRREDDGDVAMVQEVCDNREVSPSLLSSKSNSASSLHQKCGEATAAEDLDKKIASTASINPVNQAKTTDQQEPPSSNPILATNNAPTLTNLPLSQENLLKALQQSNNSVGNNVGIGPSSAAIPSLATNNTPNLTNIQFSIGNLLNALQQKKNSATLQASNTTGVGSVNAANSAARGQLNTPFSQQGSLLHLPQFLGNRSNNSFGQVLPQAPQIPGFPVTNAYQQLSMQQHQQPQFQPMQSLPQPHNNTQLMAALQMFLSQQQQQQQHQNVNQPMNLQIPVQQQLGFGQQGMNSGFTASSFGASSPTARGNAQPMMTSARHAADAVQSAPSKTAATPSQQKPAAKASAAKKSPHAAKAVSKRSRSSTGKGEQWFKRYNELKAYKEDNGNCNVPKRYTENPALGTWVSNQRSLRRLSLEGKPSHMTPERIRLLEELGFEWHPPTGPNAKQEEQWRQRCRELEEYKAENGHCRVPTKNYTPNPALGQWVNDQRRQYRLMKQGLTSSMTEERMMILSDIGFEWYSTHNSKKAAK